MTIKNKMLLGVLLLVTSAAWACLLYTSDAADEL
ncbi:hypothetical protein ACX3VG_23290, partial [Escherichia coli]